MFPDRIFLVFLCHLLNGLSLGAGQATRGPGLVRPATRTFKPIFLPPVLTTTSYEVNTSKPLWDTAVEVEDLACGKSNFCNKSLAEHAREHCFTCSKFTCRCDETCHIYGDCCVDIAIKQSGDIQQQATKRQVECQRRFPKKNKDDAGTYIFMVSRCPENTKADLQTITNCEQANLNDYEQATPVTDMTSKLIYRNSFCAKCFNVEQYKVWSYKIECQVGSLAEKATSKAELWTSVLSDTKCSVSNSPPNGTLLADIRDCIPDTQSECNVTGLWTKYNQVTEQLCGSYYDPVVNYDDRKTYKNTFCAMCNGAEVSRKKQCFSFSRSAVRPHMGRGGFSRPLSVLIDFNAEPDVLPAPLDSASKCEKGTIYNPISENCSPLMCSRRRILTDDDMCRPVYQSSQGLGYSFSLAVTPTEELHENRTSDLSNVYRNSLFKTLDNFQPLSITSLLFEPYSKKDVAIGRQLPVSDMKVVGKMVSKADASITELEQALRNLDTMETSISVESVQIPLVTRFINCPETDELVRGTNPIPWARVEMLSTPNFSGCNAGTCLDGVEYLPAHGILECPHIEIDLSQSNATYNQPNSSLEILNQTFPMHSSIHYFCENSLKICASFLYDIRIIRPSDNTTTEQIPDDADDLAMTIVSVICISLSLLCLLLTFLIYCIIPKLRTLPGKNTMALIFHLFCAQLFFQVGIQFTYNRDLCRAMGVVIHYFWLTAFAWMAISAYHMCAVFSSLATSRFGNRSGVRRTLVRYIVISNLFAAVFILSCVIYHLVTTNGSEMGYGGHICFLNEPLDIGIFFAVPVGLVLVFNVACFIRTVTSIKNVPDMKAAKNKPNRNHMHVYFRLSILLGFTWVFGFVAAIVRVNVWWYVFIILNGLQGVFIFVAYCLNKRTLKQLKSRICRKRGIQYSRPSKSSSSDRTTHSTSV